MSIWLLRRCILGLVLSVATYAQEQAVCPLIAAKNGDMVMLKGEAVHGAHDGLVRLTGCTDEVLLGYADDPSISEPKPTLKRDEMFRRFREYFNAEQPAQRNAICQGCWKYRVTAEFEGRLDITDSAGLKKDPKTGKVTGFVGFGHPMPFTRYRLVIAKVSNVETVERAVMPLPEKR